MSKVTIIGGGVSGLAAGIYAQMSGLESEIFEGHTVIGGQCTSWKRKGFHIDNCVHWMTGTSPEKEIYEVWKDVGVIGEGCKMIEHEYFMQVDFDGIKGHAWRDLNKMESELLSIAPDDKELIHSLIKAIRNFQCIELPALKPKEQMGFIDNMKLLWKMRKAIPVAVKYGKMTIGDLAQQFKSPVIRQMIHNYVPETYFAISTLYMYANFAAGNADLPLGGSDSITLKMRDRYLQLGGKISTKKKAVSIDVEGTRCTKVNFEDGTSVMTEDLICATDISVTFKLIGEKYIDDHFKYCYDNPDKYPLFSNMNVYFAVDVPTDEIPNMEIFNCEPYTVAGRDVNIVIVNNFADQPGFAPEGKSKICGQILCIGDRNAKILQPLHRRVQGCVYGFHTDQFGEEGGAQRSVARLGQSVPRRSVAANSRRTAKRLGDRTFRRPTIVKTQKYAATVLLQKDNINRRLRRRGLYKRQLSGIFSSIIENFLGERN